MLIRNMSLSRRRLTPLASLILTACVTLKVIDQESKTFSPQWYIHRQVIMQLNQYQAHGSFTYLSNKKIVYARFFLQQYSSEHYQLLLLNPLGGIELILDVQSHIVKLTDSQGKRYYSDKSEEIINKLIGMQIPLNNMRQWMLGLPGSSNEFILDDKFHIKKIIYQKDNLIWVVNYQNYISMTVPSLPSQISIKQGDQCIKLKINAWVIK